MGSRFHSNNLLISNLRVDDFCYLTEDDEWNFEIILAQERNSEKCFSIEKVPICRYSEDDQILWDGDEAIKITRIA